MVWYSWKEDIKCKRREEGMCGYHSNISHTKQKSSLTNTNSLQKLFQSPHCIKTSQYTWNNAELTADKKTLLFRHWLFDHDSLQQILWLVKLKLVYGLPDNMLAVSIKCPVALSVKPRCGTTPRGDRAWKENIQLQLVKV
ncbi:uncharacterized protein VP01_42g3 [Puccinia sorghi]|uniref:Uncharacterized protein n=1 Tax=Puccinia sorghi TaxID=27349 RepID=A0A0L6UQ54_9BASI|nr:uncharacterized protein VP01_42g3 [Puccinia sorghi]